MARPRPISGYPEFLPAGRIVEQRVLDILRETFELHGFASIETRAVEPMDVLTRKGEITKEVFLVRRLHAEESDEKAGEMGLHFDLTVPFARYVLENAGHLAFPFRRYQIQKVWRGERPQEGRYREFCQADIDIVGQDSLPEHFDVEAPLVMLEALERMHSELGLPQARMHVNNRKLAEGFYRGLGIENTLDVLQRVDKFDKIGPDAVAALLVDELGLSDQVAARCVALAGIATEDDSFVDQVRALGVEHEMLDEGLAALAGVVNAANGAVPGRIVADLKIARGLDYYTGTVYETLLVGHEKLGSVSSGGRYDALASDGKVTFPGVGISLGVTRLLAPMITKGQLTASRSVPSVVLVAVDSEESRPHAMKTAAILRGRGIACEVAPKADKFGKQIRYADRRGIPFVWFESNEVKDIRSGDQRPADPTTWQPPAEDLRPQVVAEGL
ncbi:histidine--tRNA ligase [Aestuariimicrobium sp. p3-SID1156]|uniref:histidine--tRNA ligase n=1 Tax=Aestuariimicrobium sp. p3-SID1156 TaxID=2916038 RepID=UPI00223AE6A8|nr:histidine--tRNA ligase [Aestuariimicrobium sp. p3-SID1156]MCT1459512.1 histidine--tRNA ligase [Aestuariimicrobium sp. p3-SID1156]